jgi:PhnB protein
MSRRGGVIRLISAETNNHDHASQVMENIMNHQTILQPYIFFEGRCEEALEYYRQALGARILMQMRYKDSPEPLPPGCASIDPNLIMHAQFQIGSTIVMAADGRGARQAKFEGFALSLTVPTEAEAERAFHGLADGGHIEAPLARTFFAASFGMVTDRFGLLWMVMVPASGTPPTNCNDHGVQNSAAHSSI